VCANAAHRSIGRLQAVGGTIEQFDFTGLVGRFDQARAADASITSWSLSGALSDFHTSSSGAVPIGGEVVRQYGLNGQIPVVGSTSTLAPVTAMPTDSGPTLQALAQDNSTMGSADVAQRLDPSTVIPSVDTPVPEGAVEGGAPALPSPSADEVFHGQPSGSPGGVTRGSSSGTGASSSPGHAPENGRAPAAMDASDASTTASADAGSHASRPGELPNTVSSSDVLSERIERVLDHWTRAKGAPPAIRLSHYEEILRGEIDAPDDAKSDEGVSYAGRWQRLRFLLNQHVGTCGDASSADVGSPLLPTDGIVAGVGERFDTASRFGARSASARTPLPMFAGLQDGFDRL
jgi:hypothetical protein